MSTFLLTWNPKRWGWENLPASSESVRNGQSIVDRWSTGVQTHIEPGDRLFLIRLGLDPKGVIGSGFAQSEVFKEAHWDENAEGGALYVELEWDALLNPDEDEILSLDELKQEPLEVIHWTPQASGTRVPDDLSEALEERWQSHLKRIAYGRESQGQTFSIEETIAREEGKRTLVSHLRSERHSALRDLKLLSARKESGSLRCEACGFSFEEMYDSIGVNFIEVHHKNPVATGERQTTLDDLALLCSNCHRMIHKTSSLSDIKGFGARYLKTHKVAIQDNN